MEILNSFLDHIKQKTSSILFGAYIFSFIVWNWKALYLTLFVTEANIVNLDKANKLEYLLATYYPHWWDKPLSVLVPAAIAVIGMWLALNPIFRIEKRFIKQYFDVKEYRKYQQQVARNKYLEEKVEEVKLEKEIEESFQNLSEEKKWEIEFKDNKSNPDFIAAMNELHQAFYKYDRQLYDYDLAGNIIAEYASPKSRAIWDTYDLVEYINDTRRVISDFTSKGKYFLRLYISMGVDNNISRYS